MTDGRRINVERKRKAIVLQDRPGNRFGGFVTVIDGDDYAVIRNRFPLADMGHKIRQWDHGNMLHHEIAHLFFERWTVDTIGADLMTVEGVITKNGGDRRIRGWQGGRINQSQPKGDGCEKSLE